jgi:hypothetical protein
MILGPFEKITFLGPYPPLWDDDNAYCVEFEDGEGTNVYEPIDVDTYVRPVNEIKLPVSHPSFS